MKPVLNMYSLHVPAQEMRLPERNVKVETGFPEALEAETLAACFVCIFYTAW